MDLTKKGMGNSGYCLTCGGKMAEHGCFTCDKSPKPITKMGKEPKHNKDTGKDHG